MNHPEFAVVDRATIDDIAAAYRLFLGRRPDPGGLDYFTRAVEGGISLSRLTQLFADSAEYRSKAPPEARLVEVDLGGYRVCVDPEETDFCRDIAASRDYEPHVRKAVAGRFREGQTFVDVGANVGCITLMAAMIAGPRGSVIAVEPFPANLQRLYAGIALNGFANVRVIPLAASDGRATFSLTGGTSNAYLVDSQDYRSNAVYAQSVALDDVLASEPAIHFVKMDIEGHEPFALRGLARTIAVHEPILLTEFNPRCLVRAGHEPIDYLRQLCGHYRSLEVITPFHEPAAFRDAESVLRCWHERDADLSRRGLLLKGIHHFDIIATNRDS
ncbi:MAG TPA: FkbM family methyltransferase [Isosphaeraceae bacterium]|jgi:FkbM family methyltransferase